MTVRELRKLLFDVKDQGAIVKIDGRDIDIFETSYNATIVRLKTNAEDRTAAAANNQRG